MRPALWKQYIGVLCRRWVEAGRHAPPGPCESVCLRDLDTSVHSTDFLEVRKAHRLKARWEKD